jgi:cytochrome c peroxidase
MRGETGAMSDAAVRGMDRFRNIGCVNCHKGPMFSDYTLHVLGVPDNGQLAESDAGAEGGYAFRTASLRNLRYTAPYMHSGVLEDLQDVLRFYNRVQRGGGNRGGGGNRADARNANVSRDQLDPLLRQLRGVGRGNGDLLAFLDALNDDGFDRTIPARVPSGLPVGGRIQ